MSVNTRFYHLTVSWENLLACCGIHLLRQNEGEEEQTLATTKTVRPSRESLLPLMSSKTKREEADCTPSPRRPGETGVSTSNWVTGASTRDNRSDPKGNGKQLPMCFKKKMLSIFLPWFSVMRVVTGMKLDRSSLFHHRGLLQVMRQEVDAGVGVGRGQGARARPSAHRGRAAGAHGTDETPEAPGAAPGAPVARLRVRVLLQGRRQPRLVPHVDGDVVEAVLEAGGGLPAHRRAGAPGTADQAAAGLSRRPGPRLLRCRRGQLAGRRGGLIAPTQDAAAAPAAASFAAFPERDVLHRGRVVTLGGVSEGRGHGGHSGGRGEGLGAVAAAAPLRVRADDLGPPVRIWGLASLQEGLDSRHLIHEAQPLEA